MEDRIKIKREEILNKKFKKNLKAGYDAYDVDKFFDTINTFLFYLEAEFISVDNYKNQLIIEKNDLITKLKEKEKVILLQQNELNELKENGYQNQKIIKDISSLQTNFEKIKNGNK